MPGNNQLFAPACRPPEQRPFLHFLCRAVNSSIPPPSRAWQSCSSSVGATTTPDGKQRRTTIAASSACRSVRIMLPTVTEQLDGEWVGSLMFFLIHSGFRLAIECLTGLASFLVCCGCAPTLPNRLLGKRWRKFLRRQGAELIFRHADGLALDFSENSTSSRSFSAHRIMPMEGLSSEAFRFIEKIEVEIHLARILRAEAPGLQRSTATRHLRKR